MKSVSLMVQDNCFCGKGLHGGLSTGKPEKVGVRRKSKGVNRLLAKIFKPALNLFKLLDWFRLKFALAKYVFTKWKLKVRGNFWAAFLSPKVTEILYNSSSLLASKLEHFSEPI